MPVALAMCVLSWRLRSGCSRPVRRGLRSRRCWRGCGCWPACRTRTWRSWAPSWTAPVRAMWRRRWACSLRCSPIRGCGPSRISRPVRRPRSPRRWPLTRWDAGMCWAARGPAPGYLCAAHPGDVRCPACHDEHVSACHDQRHELTCDWCGAVCLHSIYPVPVALGSLIAVRNLAARRRFAVGPVWLAGLGACYRCHRDLSRDGQDPAARPGPVRPGLSVRVPNRPRRGRFRELAGPR